MKYFDCFTSATAAGSGSQNWFLTEDPEKPLTSRLYYKLSRPVRGEMSLLYSNTIDSTYSDGSHSNAGFVPGAWRILGLRAGLVKEAGMEKAEEPAAFCTLRFNGKADREVNPGELFCCDPFPLEAPKGAYLCIEMTFSGARIPCHTESLLPAFRLGEDGRFYHCTDVPFPCMLGMTRGGEKRIGMLGDSITQGIGTEPNSYANFAALVQEALGEDVAVWNLGLGFGRAADAAQNGMWLYKARQNDVVCVCYGVNDLFQTRDAETLKKNLARIVRLLKAEGVKVLLQTVPPFDYAPEFREMWTDVNRFIGNVLAREADGLLDVVPILCKSPEQPYASAYGAHPDARGNALWAAALAEKLKNL